MRVEELCSQLVKLKSENPPGDTKDVAEYIKNYLEEIGISCITTDNPCGHTNVVSKNQNGKLLLSGHIDVVPAMDEGWNIPPYSGKIDDEYVYGRGSSDMKGGCAAVLLAAKRAADDGLTDNISLAFVCDEEGGGKYGTRYLINKKIIHPCDCLIAEPTPALGPCIGQKGVLRFRVNFNGKPGHSSLHPAIGESAIIQAVDFLSSIIGYCSKDYPQTPQLEEIIKYSVKVAEKEYGGSDFSSILRRIMYNPGIISGGERVNIVAQKCHLDMDMRTPWGIECKDVISDIKSLLPKTSEMILDTSSDASITSPDSFLVKTVCEAVGNVYNTECHPMVQWAASDARAMRCAGFNAIEYGPGVLGTIHGLNEKVSISQLEKAVDIYYNIINKYSRCR